MENWRQFKIGLLATIYDTFSLTSWIYQKLLNLLFHTSRGTCSPNVIHFSCRYYYHKNKILYIYSSVQTWTNMNSPTHAAWLTSYLYVSYLKTRNRQILAIHLSIYLVRFYAYLQQVRYIYIYIWWTPDTFGFKSFLSRCCIIGLCRRHLRSKAIRMSDHQKFVSYLVRPYRTARIGKH